MAQGTNDITEAVGIKNVSNPGPGLIKKILA